MPQERITSFVARPTEEIFLDLLRSGELEIDSNGRFWRLKVRVHGCLRPCVIRRAEHETPPGYFQLRTMIDGHRYHVGAHRVAWSHFNGPIPLGFVINHLNGRKADNRPENLEATTPSGNAIHAHRTGLKDQRGERNPAFKLTDHQISLIRLAYSQGGITQIALAEEFGVQHQHISRVIRGDRRASQCGPVCNSDHRHYTPKKSESNGASFPGRDN